MVELCRGGLLLSLVVMSVSATTFLAERSSTTPSLLKYSSVAPLPDQLQAASDLVSRVMGGLSPQFKVTLLPDKGAGMAQVGHSSEGRIEIAGTSGVEIARALNFYLNEYLNVTYDWNTYASGQLPSAGAKLPVPMQVTNHTRRVPYSYYMNVCTYGYSLPFIPWNTTDDDMKAQSWIRHIDWMALNGINLPLSFIGQEYIWTQVFGTYNITFEEQQSFYSGPAFLPWFRMGNMRGWGGPITEEWIQLRKDLQVKVLTQMRSLGMKPVLPAFAGHVPASFQTKFPNAKITRSPNWANFNGDNPATANFSDVYMLEPTDPLFIEIGSKFVQTQSQIYGTDHIYNCDTYNEMSPPSKDPSYLNAASAAVYKAMSTADPNSIWLMQGWLFISSWWNQTTIRAYLSGVPTAKMWLLDLFGDSRPIWSETASFFGHPFIWCTLLNFGGQQGIAGDASTVLSGLEKAVDNSTINGVGITMEGIWTNYPIFEITLQGAYSQPTPANIPSWWQNYGGRRYGPAAPSEIVSMWQNLGATIYSGGGGFGSDISSVPAMPSPPPPQPPAPPGFAIYSKHGYFLDFYTPPNIRQTIDGCSKLCVAATPKRCLGFEVYVDTPPVTGNCYLFFNLTTGFFPLAPCQTYLRDNSSRTRSKVDVYSIASSTKTQFRPAYYQRPGTVDGHGLTRPEELTVFQTTWTTLMESSKSLGSIASYRFDLVDVAREVIAANFSATLPLFKNAFASGNATEAVVISQTLLEIMDDYDLLLSADTNFMLGRWLAWAVEWSENEAGKALLDFNARNILTLWGPTGQINDYAKKEWGGLVRSYYRKRYSLFFSMALECLNNKTVWNQDAYANALLEQVELPFQNNYTSTWSFPSVPETDLLSTSAALIKKYVPT